MRHGERRSGAAAAAKAKPRERGGRRYGPAKASLEETPLPAAAEEPPVKRESRLAPHSERPVLPRWPFVTGTFTFPFFSGTLARVMVLTICSLLTGKLLTESIRLGVIEDPRATFLSGLFGAATLMATIAWFVFASACALTVVRETANGCDKIPEWPGSAFCDWFFEPLYLFDSLCVSVLPGMGLAWCLALLGRPAQAAQVVSLFFLFPFLLLSMLEKDSPFAAISWPVVRTLWRAWKGWASFHLATVALLAAAGNVMLAVWPAGESWRIIVASPVFVIVWFVYFRLLGRLAWYCAEHDRPEADADGGESADQENADEEEATEAE